MSGEDEMAERMLHIEWSQEQITDRLAQGAEAFGTLRESIDGVRKEVQETHDKFIEATKPKSVPVWRVAGVLFSVFVIVAAWVWQAASYPDREEFDTIQEKQQELVIDQRLLTEAMKRQEATTTKIDGKLDRLLER